LETGNLIVVNLSTYNKYSKPRLRDSMKLSTYHIQENVWFVIYAINKLMLM
jgi:hypothetical protein